MVVETKKLNILGLTILLVLIFSSLASAFSGSGTGTTNDPYLVTNCSNFQEMEDDLTGVYRLENNINCAGFAYRPVDAFGGELRGNGKTISNLQIDGNPDYVSNNFVGIFAHTIEGAYIHDFSLTNLNATGNDEVGAIVGENNDGIIYNVSVSGIVTGNFLVGGLVGGQFGQIHNSHFTGSVTGTGMSVGGLAGQMDTDIIDAIINASTFTGSVTGANSYVGGIVGDMYSGVITQTSADMTMDMTGNEDVNSVGGIAGYLGGGSIEKSHTTGSITAEYSSGGIVGDLSGGSVSNSYSTATLNGIQEGAGGIVAYVTTGVTIENTYFSGIIIEPTNLCGGCSNSYSGIVGFINAPMTVLNSYWDDDNIGATISTVDYGTPKTTAQMKQEATYSNWDFDNTWQINEGLSYPTLCSGSCPEDDEEEPSESPTGYVALYTPSDAPKVAFDLLGTILVTILGFISLIAFIVIVGYAIQKLKPK